VAERQEVVITHHGERATSPVPEAGAASPRSTSPAGEQVSPAPAVAHKSPPVEAEAGLDADHDGEALLWFRTLQNINDAGPAFGLVQ
jgi:hypothetical protein